MTSRFAASPSVALAPRAAPAPLAVGMVTWIVGLVLLPAPLAARILLLAPLVIVPRLLTVPPPRPFIAATAGWPALGAALALAASFAAPSGPLAAALAAPWLLVCCVAAAAAVAHGV